MRQIPNDERIDDPSAQTLPMQQEPTGNHRQYRVRKTTMPHRGRKLAERSAGPAARPKSADDRCPAAASIRSHRGGAISNAGRPRCGAAQTHAAMPTTTCEPAIMTATTPHSRSTHMVRARPQKARSNTRCKSQPQHVTPTPQYTTSPQPREENMLFLVISNPRAEPPSSVVAARQRYWDWIAPLQASGEVRFVYARVGRGAVVLFDVPSNEVLHQRLNEWQDIIPVQFETYPLIDPEAAQQFLRTGWPAAASPVPPSGCPVRRWGGAGRGWRLTPVAPPCAAVTWVTRDYRCRRTLPMSAPRLGCGQQACQAVQENERPGRLCTIAPYGRDETNLAVRTIPGAQLPLPVSRRSADLLGQRDGECDPRLVHPGRDRLGAAAHAVRIAAIFRHAGRTDAGHGWATGSVIASCCASCVPVTPCWRPC